MPKTILIIDDEKTIRWSLSEALREGGYDVIDAGTAEAGVKLFREKSADLVLLDLKLPDGSGLDVLGSIKDEDPGVPVIMGRTSTLWASCSTPCSPAARPSAATPPRRSSGAT